MILCPDILLIDGDIIAYQAAALAQQTVDWGDGEEPQVFLDEAKAVDVVDNRLAEFMAVLDCDQVLVCLSDDVNWRKELWPGYKAHRKDAQRPQLLTFCKNYLSTEYPSATLPRLEADDVMGIIATSGQYDFPVIVSLDKDMQTVPGWLFNPGRDDRPILISREQAIYQHMTQTLTGDSADGYKGCPGIGPKKAERILGVVRENLTDDHFILWRKELWSKTLSAYASNSVSTVDALTTARLANILVADQYNRETTKIKLWQPPQ